MVLIAHRALPRPRATERLVALAAEHDRRGARRAVEDPPPLERFEPGDFAAMTGRVTRPRLFHAAPCADAERVLLHELRQLVADAAVRSDPGAAAERARRRQAPLNRGANELALVRHRIEQGRELGLDLERDDVLGGARLPRHRLELNTVAASATGARTPQSPSEARNAASTLRSSSVEVSPFASSAPAATSFRRRRMIFPLRVFGSASVKRI